MGISEKKSIKKKKPRLVMSEFESNLLFPYQIENE
jgi:hypothetical protein